LIKTTQNLHHHASDGPEEARRHPEVPTGNSRRGGAAAKGMQGARPTTTQTSSRRLHRWEAVTVFNNLGRVDPLQALPARWAGRWVGAVGPTPRIAGLALSVGGLGEQFDRWTPLHHLALHSQRTKDVLGQGSGSDQLCAKKLLDDTRH
jgi:hypothetical protein